MTDLRVGVIKSDHVEPLPATTKVEFKTKTGKTNLLNEVLSGNYVVIDMIVPKYMVKGVFAEGDPNDQA